jgi:hypothetical protein
MEHSFPYENINNQYNLYVQIKEGCVNQLKSKNIRSKELLNLYYSLLQKVFIVD